MEGIEEGAPPPQGKLTERDRAEIVAAYAAGETSGTLAERYGVSGARILQIVPDSIKRGRGSRRPVDETEVDMDLRIDDPPPPSKRSVQNPVIRALFEAAEARPGTWVSVAVHPDAYSRLARAAATRVRRHGSGQARSRKLPSGEHRIYLRLDEVESGQE